VVMITQVMLRMQSLTLEISLAQHGLPNCSHSPTCPILGLSQLWSGGHDS